MSKKRDYYEVLGVTRTATAVEVKAAFKKLALQHHPDRNQGDAVAEERFKEASEAYAVLSDDEKRAVYDRFGHNAPGGFADGAPFPGNINDIFGDLFGEMFGGRRRGQVNRGADLRYNLELSFEEAAFGTETKLRIPRPVPCDDCQGTGSRSRGSTTCPVCHGAGQQRFQQGFFAVARTCSRCGGMGAVVADPCAKCQGEGRVRGEKELLLRVPPGLDDGSRVRLSGEGESGERAGPAGDLYIVIQVRPHPIFKRDDQTILLEVPISFTQAALGAELEVPTLDGKVKLKVPAATQTGRVFRLREKGVPSPNGSRRGDQLVTVRLETPGKLSKEQRELLERFAALSGEEQQPQSRGFFDKVRELFG